MVSGFRDFIKQVLLHFRQIEVFRYQFVYTFKVATLFCGYKLMAYFENSVRNCHRSESQNAVFRQVKDLMPNRPHITPPDDHVIGPHTLAIVIGHTLAGEK